METQKIREQIVIGGRYKTTKGEKVTVTGKFRKKGEDIYLCSDEIARDRWGNAFVFEHLSIFSAAKYNFLKVEGVERG